MLTQGCILVQIKLSLADVIILMMVISQTNCIIGIAVSL